MRRWIRAHGDCQCGLCKRDLRHGDPLQELRLPNVQSALFRCPSCAIGSVPPDLPPLVERAPIEPQPLIRAGKVKLPFDFKLAAAGRVPGEDDE